MSKNFNIILGIYLCECEGKLALSIGLNKVKTVIQKRGVATDAGSRRGCL
ncbi:MAG: hypothetical protein ACOX70_06150 [Syntrophaceticus schinkii]|jgi:hypothetical protein